MHRLHREESNARGVRATCSAQHTAPHCQCMPRLNQVEHGMHTKEIANHWLKQLHGMYPTADNTHDAQDLTKACTRACTCPAQRTTSQGQCVSRLSQVESGMRTHRSCQTTCPNQMQRLWHSTEAHTCCADPCQRSAHTRNANVVHTRNWMHALHTITNEQRARQPPRHCTRPGARARKLRTTDGARATTC